MRLFEFDNKTERISKDFIKWICDKLGIDKVPKIVLDNNKDKVNDIRTFGTTNPSDGSIWVYIGGRNTADALRTLAHEIVHHKQYLDGVVTLGMDEEAKQKIEDEANAMAGRLMREYGKINVNIY